MCSDLHPHYHTSSTQVKVTKFQQHSIPMTNLVDLGSISVCDGTQICKQFCSSVQHWPMIYLKLHSWVPCGPDQTWGPGVQRQNLQRIFFYQFRCSQDEGVLRSTIWTHAVPSREKLKHRSSPIQQIEHFGLYVMQTRTLCSHFRTFEHILFSMTQECKYFRQTVPFLPDSELWRHVSNTTSDAIRTQIHFSAIFSQHLSSNRNTQHLMRMLGFSHWCHCRKKCWRRQHVSHWGQAAKLAL